MTITLPSLLIQEKLNGNTISHLIDDEFILDITDAVLTRSYLIVIFDKKKYCLTGNKNIYPSDSDYVILYSKRPTVEELLNHQVSFKEWIKHPKLIIYTPELIVESWNDKFNFREENLVDGKFGLRKPQIGAIYKILGHFTNADDIATVVLPTGTGKTETMLSVLVANKCSRLLVTVPSDSLRTQLAKKFISLGLLMKNGNLKEDSLYPIVGVLNKKFNDTQMLSDFFSKCNVVISTMDIISGSYDEEKRMIANWSSHYFIDEAHHSKAKEWDKLINFFDKKKVLLFTATPFRNDGKILDGKIIYNFTLKDAQDQGYFKEIDFIPIREYDAHLADIIIADKAVERLRKDIQDGFDHILMARCSDSIKAVKILEIYKNYPDLDPVLIHSKIQNLNKVRQDIIDKKHKIIVCIDMLGEGFDLPELKIAAFHDIRKSLPITLQFAGRFTRTSRDSNLGRASFVANLVQSGINDELSLLYSKESNWNTILPMLSLQATQEQINLQEFLSGFSDLNESEIPFQNIAPAFSTVVYRKQKNSWFPSNFSNGISNYDSYDHKFSSLNRKDNTLIILLGSKKSVSWGVFNDIYNIEWDIFIVHWDTMKNLLFIHSSEKNGNYEDLAKAVTDDDATLISGLTVFRVFYNIKRLMLYNVGLRRGLGKDISFQSYYGGNIHSSLSSAEINSNIKNNIFGVGYEKGDKISIGCSKKGRVWSYLRGNIQQLTVWFGEIGAKLIDENIDPNTVLLETLEPIKISERPNYFPYYIDWNSIMYKELETRFEFRISGEKSDLSNTELTLITPSTNGDLLFSVKTDIHDIKFVLEITSSGFEIKKLSSLFFKIAYGSKEVDAAAFFNEYPPKIGFVNNSILEGNSYVEFKEKIIMYPKDKIKTMSWENVDLSQESMGFRNKNLRSIQYYFIEYLKTENFDVIYNDDNSGEIADIIAIKDDSEAIDVDLYHLKYAIGGKVSNDINNLYQVCGQTQKSLNWYFRDNKEFIDHLLRREYKKKISGQSRLEKGTLDDLERILNIVKNHKPIKFRIYIVQPGFSKNEVSDPILNLLAVTANHLKILTNIDLGVIASV